MYTQTAAANINSVFSTHNVGTAESRPKYEQHVVLQSQTQILECFSYRGPAGFADLTDW